MTIAPGGTIGIIGGGQLGRMLAMAAAQLGYRCHIFAPEEQPPAAAVAAAHRRGAFEDADALAEFAKQVDVVTYEFENLPVAPLARLGTKLSPGVRSLEIAQDRAVEKRFIERVGGRVAPWREVDGLADVEAAIEGLGLPLVLKSRRLGYDGKGQAWVRDAGEAKDAWIAIGARPAVAEAAVAYDAEFSVLLARAKSGECKLWDVPRNYHDGGILRRSELPAGAAVDGQREEAAELAIRLAGALDHVGVLTVEYFACAGGPIVNEIAPRVHNSGHWTIEGAATSQFEQHIRAICGLALGSTARTSERVAMDNLIGEEAAGWASILGEPGARLHLYGKGQPRAGRKMGHVTRLGG